MSSDAGNAFTPATIKSIFRPYFRDYKSSFLSEALARGCGYETHAAYSADLKDSERVTPAPVTAIDAKRFAERLAVLSGVDTQVVAAELTTALQALRSDYLVMPLGPSTALKWSDLLQDYDHIFSSSDGIPVEPNPRVLVAMFPEDEPKLGVDYVLSSRSMTDEEAAKVEMAVGIMAGSERPYGVEGVVNRADGSAAPFMVVLDDDGFRYQDYDDIRRVSRKP